MADAAKSVMGFFGAMESFFSRFVPSPFKRYYFLGFKYAIFVSGGLIGYFLYFVTQELLYKAGVHRAMGLSAGLVLAVFFTFTYHRYVTFDQKGGWKQKLAKFAPVQVVIAVINGILSYVAIENLHIPSFQATFVITFVLSLVNFAANKLFIFNDKKGQSFLL